MNRSRLLATVVLLLLSPLLLPAAAAHATELYTINDRTTGTEMHQFNYVGAWSSTTQPGAFNDDNSWSGATDAYYEVAFFGHRVDVYSAKAPNHGIAAVSVDGGPETMIDFYSPTRSDNTLAYQSPQLSDGSHTLKVRVTGTKNSASSGVYIPADRVDVDSGYSPKYGTASFNANDNTVGSGQDQFEYVGAWSNGTQPGAWHSDNHWSGQAGDYYQVRSGTTGGFMCTATGRGFAVFGSKAPNHGIAAISVDGGPEELVDFYASSRADNVMVWSTTFTGGSSHTLKVRVTGTKNPASTGAYIPADRVTLYYEC